MPPSACLAWGCWRSAGACCSTITCRPASRWAGSVWSCCCCWGAGGICAGASWYLRFADAIQGFPGDEALASDPRVVPCTYDAGALAQECTFTLNDGMKTETGQVRMHFSARVGDQVPAGYQPQRGCTVDKGADGNTHTMVATKPKP